MNTTVVVIGAGHAGLAVSHHLSERSTDHVILERGEVANTWRKERWDSLRLLTPNWQTRLPGLRYDGNDPDGFMTVPEIVGFITRYSEQINAPVVGGFDVCSLRVNGSGYEVRGPDTSYQARAVVIASGGFNQAKVPVVFVDTPGRLDSVTSIEYKRPDQLPDGGVMVVGAAATGVQIADELLRSGREVVLSVGEHVRMPRTYRGKDILWWMEQAGILDERYDQIDDIVRARHVASPQLAGTSERVTLDLNALSERGVRLVGRLSGFSGTTAYFSGSLRNVCNLADLKQARLLDTIDEWAIAAGDAGAAGDSERFARTRVPDDPTLSLDLEAAGVKSVVWATGYRSDYSWLDIPVLDRKGELRHDGGVVTDVPGLYRIGLNFLRRRKSSFIHGAEDDARDIVDSLGTHLDSVAARLVS